MTDDTTDHVLVSIKDGIQHIELNRADKMNALTTAMYGAITKAFKDSHQNPDIKVILFYGTPGCFTSGNDIKDFLKYSTGGSLDNNIEDFLIALTSLEKPLIVAVDGPAIGVGTTMLFHADLVYATDRAVFATPFASLGLTPEAASSYLMPRIMGHVRAFEMLALGSTYSADQAKQSGMINEIVEPKDLINQTHNIALKLAAKPQEAIRLTKQLMRGKEKAKTIEIMVEEIEVFKRQLNSPEAKAAFAAFLAK